MQNIKNTDRITVGEYLIDKHMIMVFVIFLGVLGDYILGL
jgi:hypothetical protein